MAQSSEHIPVLVEETSEALEIKKGKKYIDATLGAGGHAKAILKAGGSLLGIEASEEMLEVAKENLKGLACPTFKLVQGNFRKIDELAKKAGFGQVDGILYDLGISSLHYKMGRGFSFESGEELLDMRLDTKSQKVTAYDLLNKLREEQLAELFSVGMEKKEAKRLAKNVVEARKKREIKKVGELLEVIGGDQDKGKIHPATKALMALRIAVNSELANLEESLPKARELLKSGGKLVVISFHSGEDRIVKRMMRRFEEEGWGKVKTKKPIMASKAERARNRRARSAKMRVFKAIK